MASETKEKVAKALAEVKKDNEDFDFDIFESGDFLRLLQTTNSKTGDSQKKPDELPPEETPEQNEPKIEDEPDPDEEEGKGKGKDKDKEDEKEGKDDDDKDGKGGKKRREIKVGDKVRIKQTGRVGVVTQVNPDGTYVVSEDNDNVDFADGGTIVNVFDADTGDEIGTYQEEELEVISEEDGGDGKDGGDDGGDEEPPEDGKEGKGGKKGGKKGGDPETDPDPDGGDDDDDDPDDDNPPDPNAPPRPPKPVDIDELKRKFRKIRTHTFKLPLFAKSFFNADLNNQLFYDEQSPLVLFNRAAKDVLNPRKNVSLDTYTSLFNFNVNYIREHVPFLRTYMHYIPDANGNMVYMINPQIRFVFPESSPLFEISGMFSLEGMEQLMDLEPQLAQAFVPLIRFLEKIIVNDNFYYRILSLSAVFNPEYFSRNYLKTHLDFLSSYFLVNMLTFSNQRNIYTEVEVTDSLMYTTTQNEGNMLVINSIKPENKDEDYILYVCRNVISFTGDKIKIDRILLENAADSERLIIVQNLTGFYTYSFYMKSNSNAKKTVLGNMRKYGTLQDKLYKNFLLKWQVLNFEINGL